LKGRKADSPEAILRARFTAVRFKDVKFLANTEERDGVSSKQRLLDWTRILKVRESEDMFDNLQFWLTGNQARADQMSQAQALEILDVDNEEGEVEFKIRCTDGSVVHERSVFVPDTKWGYIFAGRDVPVKLK